MSSPTPDARDVAAALSKTLHEHWGLFLTEGIILLVLGVLAIVVPPLASLAVTVLIGWLFLISGIAGLVMTFMARRAPGFWWALLSAVIAILAGGALLWSPVQGVLSLTFVVIAFFLIDGVLSIVLVPLICRLFPEPGRLDPMPPRAPSPLSRDERFLAVILTVALVLFATDFFAATWLAVSSILHFSAIGGFEIEGGGSLVLV